MANTIEEYVNERSINYLVHFTRLANLASILQRGLVTRDTLELEGNGELNDQYRLDGTNAICVSIGFPNYKMFYRLRREHEASEWIVLVIKTSALWQLPAAFCVTNAASAEVTAIPLQQRMTLDAFKAMYGDFNGKVRSTLGLENRLPTNPQAEVLMVAGVPRQYVLGAYVQTEGMKKKIEAMYPGFEVRVNNAYFSARSDYAHWR